MSAADTLLSGDTDAQGHVILSELGAQAMRDFINDCIAEGVPPGVSLRLCSRHDLGSRFVITDDRQQGERIFEVVLDATPMHPHQLTHLFAVIDVPGSEHIGAALEHWLRPVAVIEQQLAAVAEIAADAATAAGRLSLLASPLGRETARTLDTVERTGNAACDSVRAITADPRNWKPIGPTAVLYGVMEAISVEVPPTEPEA